MTQRERIIRHLTDYGSITQKEAMDEYGIYRLASRISDIKKMDGIKIRKTMESGMNRYGEKTSFARYEMVKEK